MIWKKDLKKWIDELRNDFVKYKDSASKTIKIKREKELPKPALERYYTTPFQFWSAVDRDYVYLPVHEVVQLLVDYLDLRYSEPENTKPKLVEVKKGKRGKK